MDFQINKFAFLCGDSEYFEWFKNPSKDSLVNVIKWKRLRRGTPKIDAIWNNERQDLDENKIASLKLGVVTRAFLLHLKNPLECPIFDINVFQAMNELKGRKRRYIGYTVNQDDYNEYKVFFKEHYKEYEKEISNNYLPRLDGINLEIVKRRVLDRALWEFGRVENSPFKKS